MILAICVLKNATSFVWTFHLVYILMSHVAILGSLFKQLPNCFQSDKTTNHEWGFQIHEYGLSFHLLDLTNFSKHYLVCSVSNSSWKLLSFVWLCNPMDYTVHAILQARILEWGSLSLLQGIFPTQRSNPGLLHCRQILYQLSHKRSPRTLEWVACPFSRGSSRPRNLGSRASQADSLPTKLSGMVCVLSHVWLPEIPWTTIHQVPLSMGFFQARILEWLAIS